VGRTTDRCEARDQTASTDSYKHLSIEDATRLLESTPQGLVESEARSRIGRFGYNEVLERRRRPAIEFFSRFWGPVPWLLELTTALSIAIGHYLEAGIIFALLSTNAVIGFHRSRGAQKALTLLKKRLAIVAKVLRDGTWTTKSSREIVPGDIIALGLGDVVPADAKIVTGQVSLDQSALTGESLPVSVEKSGIVYSSSMVKRGNATALALNTGSSTFFGKTAELVNLARPKSHQEELMFSLVKYTVYFSIGALLLVIADAIAVHAEFLLVLTFTLIFLIATVPVALPAVFTIVLSVGATELAKRGALVTRLDSIEDAASVEVLCLDKTGTVTENKLSVAAPLPSRRYTEEDVVLTAALASSVESRDAIDMAVLDYAEELKINLDAYRLVSFTPFDPSTKLSEAIVDGGGRRFRVVKGAPRVVLSRLGGEGRDSSNEEKAVEELSGRGYRTLAVARSSDGQDDLNLVGLLPLADPPRQDSSAMISELRSLGVSPKMLTGDNIAIAREVGREVKLGNEIYRMTELDGLNKKEQERVIEECDGFAEVYPEDKYRIVKILQSDGRMVGMTGDGVNDAPALRQAEVGIAVQNSTDVARASSSIVLTEPGMRVIIDAIKESRRIYQRLLTWMLNRVTRTIQFLGLLVFGFFWFHSILLSVLGMVLLVFASDFLAISLATDNVMSAGKPNLWDMKKISISSFLVGLVLLAGGIAGVEIGSAYFHLGQDQLQTFVMLMLLFTSQFRVLIVRERRHFWSSTPGRELTFTIVIAVAAFSLLGIFGIVVPALSPFEVVAILAFSVVVTLAADFPKYLIFKRLNL
jgi:H+-transporting ATPase